MYNCWSKFNARNVSILKCDTPYLIGNYFPRTKCIILLCSKTITKFCYKYNRLYDLFKFKLEFWQFKLKWSRNLLYNNNMEMILSFHPK